MSRRFSSCVCWMLCVLTAVSGCTPTQPFYLHEDGDLSHYLSTVQDITYPDVDKDPTPQAAQVPEPITLSNMEFAEFWDLSLEEAVSIALQNSDVIRDIAQVNQFGQDRLGVGTLQNAATTLDPAITATGSAPAPQTVDGNGNRLLPRGAATLNPQQGVEDALAEFDAQRLMTFTYNNTDRPRNVGNTNLLNFQQFQAKDASLLSAVSKRSATGAVWTVRSRTEYSRNNIPLGPGREVPSDFTAVLEAEVTYPLLRNRGVQINRIPVMLARINEDVSLDVLEQRVRDLVMQVETAYWDLYCSYRIFDVNKAGRDAALEVWQIDKSKVPQKSPGEAEGRSEEQFHSFQNQVNSSFAGNRVQNEDGILGRESNLRYLMGLEPTDDRGLIRPSDEPTLAKVRFDWESAKIESLYRSPELRQLKRRIQQRELELISAKNQLLPELNLSMGYRLVGVGDKLYDGGGRNGIAGPMEGSVAWEELTGGEYAEAFFNLTYLPPAVGKRRQKLGVSNAQKQLIADTKRLEEAERAHINQLTNEIRQLDSLHASAEQTLSQVRAALREVRSLSLKRNREVVYDQLLDAQRRLATAGILYWRAVCEYNRQIARVHWVKGSLLDHNNIYLAEGAWPQKAYWDAMERARERDASTILDYGFTRPSVLSRGPVVQQYEDVDGLVPAPLWEGPANRPAETPLNPALPLETLPDTPAEELPPAGPPSRYEDGAPAPPPPPSR